MNQVGDDHCLSSPTARPHLPLLTIDRDDAAYRALGATSRLDTYLRYYHTLRYLRPVQVYGRAWHRLAPSTAPTGGASLPLRQSNGGWRSGVRREPTMLGPTTFCFLDRTFDISTAVGGWNLEDAPEKLWLLNLHYFDDLNAADSHQRREWHYALLSNWIGGNLPGEGIGWRDAYALSLRIVNWIKWHLSGNPLTEHALRSLTTQVRHLEANLETYLLGNHVLANAKALVFAGAFFRGAEAERWRNRGLQLLERELDEEVLEDGGHYERSPMYHGIVLEDLLDLFQLSCLYPALLSGNLPDVLTDITTTMRFWLKTMSHPDGEIGFFNDAALGIAPNAAALERYALELGHAPSGDPGDGLTYLNSSGYARYQRGPLCAFVDIGEIGPDHIPGHAHADTLSFEVSLFGQRVLVNSGTSVYKVQPMRQQERGTAAHNTVTVDGLDSSEVWGAFRVARRARPCDLKFHESAFGLEIKAAHDGYRRLPGKVTHHRTFCFAENRMTVTDVLTGRFTRAAARFHVHPRVTLAREKAILSVTSGDGISHRLTCDFRADEMGRPGNNAIAYRTPFAFHPGFGISEPSECLVIPLGPRTDGQPSRSQFFLGWE